MLRTFRAHKKSKPEGAGVRIHRNANVGLVFGKRLGATDPQFKNILKSNNLIDVNVPGVLLTDAGYIQDALDKHGPLMVIGDFFLKIFGHWIVITGTAPNDRIHFHDPAWIGGERTEPVKWLVAKRHPGSPIIANDPSAWE